MEEQHSYSYWKKRFGGATRKRVMTKEQALRKYKWENTKKVVGEARHLARKGARVAGKFQQGMVHFYSTPAKKRGGWM